MYLQDRRSSSEELSEYSLEDILDRDTSNIFSDPESEWNPPYKAEEPEDEMQITDLRPESDQPSQCEKYTGEYKIPSYTYQHLELDS